MVAPKITIDVIIQAGIEILKIIGRMLTQKTNKKGR